MKEWQTCLCPVRFADIQDYAIAQLNRRGIIPVCRGGTRLFRHAGVNIRYLPQEGSTFYISAFCGKPQARFLAGNSWRGKLIIFPFEDLAFEVERNGTLLVVGGPARCPRCLAICPFHKEAYISPNDSR